MHVVFFLLCSTSVEYHVVTFLGRVKSKMSENNVNQVDTSAILSSDVVSGNITGMLYGLGNNNIPVTIYYQKVGNISYIRFSAPLNAYEYTPNNEELSIRWTPGPDTLWFDRQVYPIDGSFLWLSAQGFNKGYTQYYLKLEAYQITFCGGQHFTGPSGGSFKAYSVTSLRGTDLVTGAWSSADLRLPCVIGY